MMSKSRDATSKGVPNGVDLQRDPKHAGPIAVDARQRARQIKSRSSKTLEEISKEADADHRKKGTQLEIHRVGRTGARLPHVQEFAAPTSRKTQKKKTAANQKIAVISNAFGNDRDKNGVDKPETEFAHASASLSEVKDVESDLSVTSLRTANEDEADIVTVVPVVIDSVAGQESKARVVFPLRVRTSTSHVLQALRRAELDAAIPRWIDVETTYSHWRGEKIDQVLNELDPQRQGLVLEAEHEQTRPNAVGFLVCADASSATSLRPVLDLNSPSHHRPSQHHLQSPRLSAPAASTAATDGIVDDFLSGGADALWAEWDAAAPRRGGHLTEPRRGGSRHSHSHTHVLDALSAAWPAQPAHATPRDASATAAAGRAAPHDKGSSGGIDIARDQAAGVGPAPAALGNQRPQDAQDTPVAGSSSLSAGMAPPNGTALGGGGDGGAGGSSSVAASQEGAPGAGHEGGTTKRPRRNMVRAVTSLSRSRSRTGAFVATTTTRRGAHDAHSVPSPASSNSRMPRSASASAMQLPVGNAAADSAHTTAAASRAHRPRVSEPAPSPSSPARPAATATATAVARRSAPHTPASSQVQPANPQPKLSPSPASSSKAAPPTRIPSYASAHATIAGSTAHRHGDPTPSAAAGSSVSPSTSFVAAGATRTTPRTARLATATPPDKVAKPALVTAGPIKVSDAAPSASQQADADRGRSIASSETVVGGTAALGRAPAAAPSPGGRGAPGVAAQRDGQLRVSVDEPPAPPAPPVPAPPVPELLFRGHNYMDRGGRQTRPLMFLDAAISLDDFGPSSPRVFLPSSPGVHDPLWGTSPSAAVAPLTDDEHSDLVSLLLSTLSAPSRPASTTTSATTALNRCSSFNHFKMLVVLA